jgi:hypothetical protein
MLDMGGEIKKAHDKMSMMLNGLRYYSVEVNLDENCYNIQAFEQQAVELFKASMILLSYRTSVITGANNKIE